MHRVIFPKDARRGGDDRYSIAFFCHPVDSTRLEPVPSEMVSTLAGEVGGFADEKVLTAAEHLQGRLKATYLSVDWDKDGKKAK